MYSMRSSIPFPIPQSSGCVSGCSEGHVVHWDMNSGNCVHDLGEYGVLVMKLECAGGSTVGLFAENSMVVWENSTGETLYTLAMVRDRQTLANIEFHVQCFCKWCRMECVVTLLCWVRNILLPVLR